MEDGGKLANTRRSRDPSGRKGRGPRDDKLNGSRRLLLFIFDVEQSNLRVFESSSLPLRENHHSYASASIGSFCAALTAGYSAPMIDPRMAMRVALRIQPPVTTTRSVERRSIPARADRLKRTPTMMPPIANSTVSRNMTLTI